MTWDSLGIIVAMGAMYWAIRTEIRSEMRDFHSQMRDFHGRLCTLEERFLHYLGADAKEG